MLGVIAEGLLGIFRDVIKKLHPKQCNARLHQGQRLGFSVPHVVKTARWRRRWRGEVWRSDALKWPVRRRIPSLQRGLQTPNLDAPPHEASRRSCTPHSKVTSTGSAKLYNNRSVGRNKENVPLFLIFLYLLFI